MKIKSHRKWQLLHINSLLLPQNENEKHLNGAKEEHVDLQNLPAREVGDGKAIVAALRVLDKQGVSNIYNIQYISDHGKRREGFERRMRMRT